MKKKYTDSTHTCMPKSIESSNQIWDLYSDSYLLICWVWVVGGII